MWPSPATATSELRHAFANPLCHIAAPKAGRTPADVGKLPPPKQFRMDERGRVALNLCAVKTILLSLALIAETALTGFAQGTAFTYQGRLNNSGNPANGNFDFAFTVFGTNSGGSPITGTITNPSVSVNNGLFTSALDFGSFLTGNPAWLEIGVRSNGNGGFVTLVPRQQLTPTPYAMFANTASNVVGAINGNLITTGTIGAAQIAPGSVGITQLAPAAATGLLALQVPSNTNLQAVANCSYVFTNAVANQLTLPANPNVGDRVRVTGGVGGFGLVANTGQSIISPSSFLWTPLNAGINAQSVAMNADGSKMVSCQPGGFIYVSTNYGVNWSTNNAAGSGAWASVAVNADGSRMVAGQDGGSPGFIYISSNCGADWNTNNDAGWGAWVTVAMSADGSKLIAGQSFGYGLPYGYIYTSTNYGVNWVQQTSAGPNSWGFVAMSADGSKMFGGQRGYYSDTWHAGFLATSTNSGVSWSTSNDGGYGDWYCGAMSADGSRMVAAQYPGYVYTSANFGANWTRQLAPGSNYWQSVAISADGSKIIAANINASSSVTNGGFTYISTNYGMTWAKQPNMGSSYWTSVAMSADGNKTIAGQYGGNIDWIPNYITQWSTVYVYGGPYANMELVYTGGGLWTPAFYTGNFTIQ